jgi:hypothetical protein
MTSARILLFAVLLLPVSLRAQVRVGTLIIKKNQVYNLGQSDILVADTLIMQDSSRLVLNKLKRENFIRTKVAVFGNYCVIDGKGLEGKTGRKGRTGSSPIAPCTSGTQGTNGGKGFDGTPGINLFLYLEKITFKGKLIVDLSGGNGGTGGNGGNGGGGGPGTVHCNGGNGGIGGNAGPGGNGSDGGTLTLSIKANPKAKELIGHEINVWNQGGYPGQSGEPGYFGSAGLGPSRRHGKDGVNGKEGRSGGSGLQGAVKIESN